MAFLVKCFHIQNKVADTRLKNNNASNMEKKLALTYLKLLNKYLEEELSKPKWEKIELESH